MEYTRNCPRCNIEIKYVDVGYYNRATNENRHCRPCSCIINGENSRGKSKSTGEIIVLERNCPKCNKHLIYKVYQTWWWANNQNHACGTCCKKGIPHRASKNTPWNKRCPTCNSTQFYHSNQRLRTAIKNNLKCMSCSQKERTRKIPYELSPDGKYKKVCPKCLCDVLYKRYTAYTKSVRKNVICQHCSRAEKRGTKHTKVSIQKMREAIQNRYSYPNYNRAGCSYMDSLNPQYNFQHALNGGEFRVSGYSVDGYDEKKNVVFEYDEPRHYSNGKLKESDMKRMDEIKKELNCEFLRYDERNKVLKKY